MYQSGSPPGSGEDRKVAKSEKFSPLQFANAKLARINFYTLGGRSLPGRQCQLLHFFAVSNIIHFTCSVQHNALYTVLTVTNYPCGKLVGGRPSGATNRGHQGPPRHQGPIEGHRRVNFLQIFPFVIIAIVKIISKKLGWLANNICVVQNKCIVIK